MILRLEFPRAFPSINRALRTNRWARRKQRMALAWEIWAQLQRQRAPPAPIEHARILVLRYSSHPLDPDNLPSCAKHLLDVLQPPSPATPSGLGVIRNDNARHLSLIVRNMPLERGEKPRTVVVISDIELDVLKVAAAS